MSRQSVTIGVFLVLILGIVLWFYLVGGNNSQGTSETSHNPQSENKQENCNNPSKPDLSHTLPASPSQNPSPLNTPNDRKPSWVIKGRIVDAATSKPVGGALLEMSYRKKDNPSAVTDDNGYYQLIADEEPSGWHVYLTIPNSSYQKIERVIDGTPKANEFALDIELNLGMFLKGEVRDTFGNLLPDTELYISPSEGPSPSYYPVTHSDEEGKFLFRLTVEEPATHQLRAAHTEYNQVNEYESVDLVPGVYEKTVTVVMERAPQLKGVVRDLAGRPIGGAEVGYYIDYKLDTKRFHRVVKTTASDGTFRIHLPDPTPDRHLWMTAQAKGYRRGFLEYGKLIASGTHQDIEIRLEPGAELRGTLRDEDGRPVAGAVLGFWRNKDNETNDFLTTLSHGMWDDSAVTDANGEFVVTSLDPAVPYAVDGSFNKDDPREDWFFEIPDSWKITAGQRLPLALVLKVLFKKNR